MSTIESFITDLMGRRGGELDATGARLIADELAAGEYETAAILMIDAGPVTISDVDEFETLIAQLDEVDRQIARRVVIKRRAQLAA